MRHYNLKSIIFIIIAIIAQRSFSQTHQIDITSYDVITNWDLLSNNLYVATKLELKNMDPIDEFKMLLKSNATIESIKSNVDGKQIDIPYYFVGKDTLNLIVPPKLKLKKELTIDFDYILPVDTLKNGMVFLRRENRWYLLQYDDIARWKLLAQIPNDYIAFSTGDLVEKRTSPKYSQFLWENRGFSSFPLIIMKLESIAKIVQKNIDGKNIKFYFSSKDTAAIENIVAQTCGAFKFYTGLIGDYGYNQLTLIEIPGVQFAQSLNTIIMVGSLLIHYFNRGLNKWPAHEVAHQWGGSAMCIKSNSSGRWFIEESLPRYLSLMYLEKTKGKDALNEALQSNLEKYKSIAGTEKDVPLIDIKYYQSKEAGIIIYKKGPYIIHKLRRKIGEDNWSNLIKEIYKNYKGRFFTYDEFKKCLSGYDKDGSCILMLEKWLTKKGIPKGKTDE